MAIKFVFEDGEDTPSSILLKNTFAKNNIFFSGGCSKALNKACSIKKSGDTVYIFYDVAPNYAKTVNSYNTLIQTIRQKKLKDIYVIPIICIEYYICAMFYKYNYLELARKDKQILIDNLITKFDWQSVISNMQLNTYELDSLEHMYKSILTSTKMKCQRNKFKYDKNTGLRDINSIAGVFYEKDCPCAFKYCSINCGDNILLKAERLYTQLPVITVVSQAHEDFLKNMGITITKKSNSDIRKERQDFYNEICKSMCVNRINVIV